MGDGEERVFWELILERRDEIGRRGSCESYCGGRAMRWGGEGPVGVMLGRRDEMGRGGSCGSYCGVGELVRCVHSVCGTFHRNHCNVFTDYCRRGTSVTVLGFLLIYLSIQY